MKKIILILLIIFTFNLKVEAYIGKKVEDLTLKDLLREKQAELLSKKIDNVHQKIRLHQSATKKKIEEIKNSSRYKNKKHKEKHLHSVLSEADEQSETLLKELKALKEKVKKLNLIEEVTHKLYEIETERERLRGLMRLMKMPKSKNKISN